MVFREWDLKDLMAFNIIGQAGVFMRKKALDASGYLDPSYHYLLDHQLWLRIAEKYKINTWTIILQQHGFILKRKIFPRQLDLAGKHSRL
jgi:hypothetical protein